MLCLLHSCPAPRKKPSAPPGSKVNGVFMQETFNVAASDDRVMIQKRKRIFQLHRLKMERFFHLADKSSDGAIDIVPWY